MNGLDDLRGMLALFPVVMLMDSLRLLAWTLDGAIQPHIDVYLTQDTFTEVQRSFPYLVSKEFASGGGDVCLFP
jgi:hypothetical protein